MSDARNTGDLAAAPSGRSTKHGPRQYVLVLESNGDSKKEWHSQAIKEIKLEGFASGERNSIYSLLSYKGMAINTVRDLLYQQKS